MVAAVRDDGRIGLQKAMFVEFANPERSRVTVNLRPDGFQWLQAIALIYLLEFAC